MDALARWVAGLELRGTPGATLAGFPSRMAVARGPHHQLMSTHETVVYLVIRGRPGLHTPTGRVPLAPGDALLLPAGSTFAVLSDRAVTVLRCRLRTPPLRKGERQPLVLRSAWELEPVMAMIGDQLAARQPDPLQEQALVALLLARMRALRDRSPRQRGGLTPAQRAAIAALAERNRARGLAPADLARELGLTLDYLTRRFRATYGMPPRRWLVRDRITAAAARLAEGHEPLAAVATALGYADLKLFGRQFRAVMGSPPGRWRRGARGG